MRMLIDDLKHSLSASFFAQTLGFKPDDWQKKVLDSNSKRIILNCSRQSGKSTTTSILALHNAIYRPSSLILLISPSQRQSSELFKKVTSFFKELDNRPSLVEDNKLSCTLSNKSRIISLPSSEGTIRGYSGADLIIEDEASFVTDDVYKAIRPMLAVSNGKLILMSTPCGKRGHFYHEWTEGKDWEKIKITAYDCPRITKEFLKNEMNSLGDRTFRQEYMCEFMENEDNVFAYDLIQQSLSNEVRPLFT